MYSTILSLACLVALTQVEQSCAATEALCAQMSKVKLPSGRQKVAVTYDGDDSIFIAGGQVSAHPYKSSAIYRYSISGDTWTLSARLLWEESHCTPCIDSDGSIVYIGGAEGRTSVQKFYPGNGTVRRAGSYLPVNYEFSAAQVEPRACYLYGGGLYGGTSNRVIYRWDMETENRYTIGELPATASGYAPIVTFITPERNVYYMNVGSPGYSVQVTVHNLTSTEAESLPTVVSGFKNDGITGAYDGRDVYLFGDRRTMHDTTAVRYNVATNTAETLPIHGYPGVYDQSVYHSKSVYVEKLKRIYFFGGRLNGGYYDGIWYVDLDNSCGGPTPTPEPTEPPTPPPMCNTTPEPDPVPSTSTTTLNPEYFDCSDKVDGVYPHPLDCVQFIGCEAGLPTFFRCPDPLIFDRASSSCGHPSWAVCGIECVGKEDGAYAHPDDCRLFVDCHEEVHHVYACPSPLLFDSELRRCNLPHLVNCNE